jgi:hypothetical protein
MVWCSVEDGMVQSGRWYGVVWKMVWCRVEDGMVQSGRWYGAEWKNSREELEKMISERILFRS